MIRDPRAVLYSQRTRWKKKWLEVSSIPLNNVLLVLSNYHPCTHTKLWKKSALVALKHKGHERYKVIVFEKLLSYPRYVITEFVVFLELNLMCKSQKYPRLDHQIKYTLIINWNFIGCSGCLEGETTKGVVYICRVLHPAC